MDRKDGVNSIETEIKPVMSQLQHAYVIMKGNRERKMMRMSLWTQIKGSISSLTGTSFMYHLVGDCRTAKEEENNKGKPVSEISQ